MEQLMLINPSKRPAKRKKARTAAQKAATKRMVAARKGAPAKRKSTAISAIKRRIKSRRKNPIGGGIMSMFVPAAKGALGAVAVNTVQAQLVQRFLPASMAGNMGKYATRIGLALAVGTLGGRLIGNANARQAAEGALTVALHDVIVVTANRVLPKAMNLAAYAPDTGMGAYAPMLTDETDGGMGGVDEMIDATDPYAYSS